MPQVLQLGPAKGVAWIGLDLTSLLGNALSTRSKALKRLLTYPARPAKPGFPTGDGPLRERSRFVEVCLALTNSLSQRNLK